MNRRVTVSIPREYEQTPSQSIERDDGSFVYFFHRLDDSCRSIVVIDNEILDWTKYFSQQMDEGNIKK